MKGFNICLVLLSLVIVSYALECDRATGVCKELWGKTAGYVPNLQIQPNKMNPRYKISDFVKNLVPTLTLKEKIGQMTQLDISMILDNNALAAGQVALNVSALQYGIQQYGIGSYLNSPFANGPIGTQSGFTSTQWASFLTNIYNLAASYTNNSIPLIYGLDSVHGANYIYGATMFPHNTGIAATFNSTAAHVVGKIAAKDTRASGIPWVFAPVTGVGVNPLWSRLYETFGEDPFLTGVMATEAIKGIEHNGVINTQFSGVSSIKHYLGYPAPKSGKDRTVAWMGQRQLLKYFAPPFARAINDSVPRTLMVNSGAINNIPVHSDREILTTLLRDKMGFGGVIVTDWQDIEKLVFFHHLVPDNNEAIYLAIQAGIDMSMVPSDYSFGDGLYQLVTSGRIPESRIDESVERILQLKEDLGLFGPNYFPTNQTLIDSVGSDWEASIEIARQSITLLKNQNQVLPITYAPAKILVTGPAGNSLSVLAGGWSIHWQGAEDYEFPYGTTIYEGISQFAAPNTEVVWNQGVNFTNVIDIQSVVNDASTSNLIVLCLGEAAEAETPGDINDLSLSAPQIQLYTALENLGIPIVLVLVEARPRILGPAANSDAILMAYLPSPIGGQVIAEILFGVISPSGRLPITYPQFTGDVGVNYYHLYSDSTSPLYQFGDGLSYTTFSYSNLHLQSPTWNINTTSSFSVSFTVTNTGPVTSDESILLFVSDDYCTVSPEVKMLRKFTRDTFAPNQSFGYTFSLTAEDVTFINRELNPAIEAGTFTVTVGTLSGNFNLVVNQ